MKHLRPKQKRTPVTIIVGIVTADQIILASDSQTTYGTQKKTDTNKISVVEFKNGCALVAESGNAELSQKAVTLFMEKAAGHSIDNSRDVITLAEQAVKEVRKEQVELYGVGNFTLEEWQIEFRDNRPFELMVAYYHNAKPFVYTVHVSVGIACKVNSHYAAIGCGSNLGAYLLNELTYPEMDNNVAAAIAVYVIESVKKHDALCGGNTKVALLNMQRSQELEAASLPGTISFPYYAPPYRIFSTREVDELSEIVSAMDKKTKKQRVDIIQKSIFKASERFFKQLHTAKRIRRTKSS